MDWMANAPDTINVGYASLAHEPNPLGLHQSLSLITLKDKGDQTILQWDVYFNAENAEFIEMNIIGFEQALNIDISQNLIANPQNISKQF